MNAKVIECGRVVRPVGLRGEIAVGWMGIDSPVRAGCLLFIGKNQESSNAYKVTALSKRGRFFVVKLERVETRDEALSLKGLKIFVSESDLPKLGINEYYTHQLLGLDVYSECGTCLGKIAKIFTAGETDVYEVRGIDGREILIPAIDSVVLSIDVAGRRLVVRLMEGMVFQ